MKLLAICLNPFSENTGMCTNVSSIFNKIKQTFTWKFHPHEFVSHALRPKFRLFRKSFRCGRHSWGWKVMSWWLSKFQEWRYQSGQFNWLHVFLFVRNETHTQEKHTFGPICATRHCCLEEGISNHRAIPSRISNLTAFSGMFGLAVKRCGARVGARGLVIGERPR